MKPIKKLTGVITDVTDLSATAREVTVTLSEPLDFSAGSFMNVFIKSDDTVLRRAFSIASSETDTKQISFAIRHDPTGAVSPRFWQPTIIGSTVELMGPLGLNTAEKMLRARIFLFGFGIGAGVIKALADHFVRRGNVTALTIMTGSRTVEEILYADYFAALAARYSFVSVVPVVSQQNSDNTYKHGYLQDHVHDYTFDNSMVYVCGQEHACNELVATIKAQQPTDCHFFVEGFH